MADIFCGDTGCGDRMQCVQVGVWVNDGFNQVRAGDVYACPTCHKEVVVGAPQPVGEFDNEVLFARVKRALDSYGVPYIRNAAVLNH